MRGRGGNSSIDVVHIIGHMCKATIAGPTVHLAPFGGAVILDQFQAVARALDISHLNVGAGYAGD